MPLHCEIITQERQLLDDRTIDVIIAPSIDGVMTILPQHAPLVAALDFGELVVRRGEEEEYFAIGGGVLEVANDHVIVLADDAAQADEIDIRRAEHARERARQSMEEGPEEAEQYAALEAQLRLAKLQLKVARRRQPTSSGATRTAQFEDTNN